MFRIRRRSHKRYHFGVKVNQLSNRLLPARRHTILEAIAVKTFFIIILFGLTKSGLNAGLGVIAVLYSGAILLIVVALAAELSKMALNYLAASKP